MLANKHKKAKTKESRKTEPKIRCLKIKKELDEIIERTEGQNKALGKILKKPIRK